jgi:cobalamin biosynthesis protein CbiG
MDGFERNDLIIEEVSYSLASINCKPDQDSEGRVADIVRDRGTFSNQSPDGSSIIDSSHAEARPIPPKFWILPGDSVNSASLAEHLYFFLNSARLAPPRIRACHVDDWLTNVHFLTQPNY